jgi:DNA-binding transcriptional MerR regulator
MSGENKALPAIPAKRYFTIGEVSELCGVKAYVLRYWEQEFTQLRPMKRRGNRRYYQHHEVLLIRRIRELLYDQGFTISGARNQLVEAGYVHAHAPAAMDESEHGQATPGYPDPELEEGGREAINGSASTTNAPVARRPSRARNSAQPSVEGASPNLAFGAEATGAPHARPAGRGMDVATLRQELLSIRALLVG